MGLYTVYSVKPGYLITLPSLGTTSFQSATSSNTPCGRYRHEAVRGVGANIASKALPGPLISGSEAIMPSLFYPVKRFVVLFFKHYIFRLIRLISQFSVL